MATYLHLVPRLRMSVFIFLKPQMPSGRGLRQLFFFFFFFPHLELGRDWRKVCVAFRDWSGHYLQLGEENLEKSVRANVQK